MSQDVACPRPGPGGTEPHIRGVHEGKPGGTGNLFLLQLWKDGEHCREHSRTVVPVQPLWLQLLPIVRKLAAQEPR